MCVRVCICGVKMLEHACMLYENATACVCTYVYVCGCGCWCICVRVCACMYSHVKMFVGEYMCE